MADVNKVRFGLSNVYAGTYTDDNGTVTLGTPQKIAGAVSLSLDPETAESVFYADNIKYFVRNQSNGYTGELEMAKFPDEFKTSFMNYVALTGGGTAESKLLNSKTVYIMFEVQGDKQARRTIMYNVELGAISEEHNTVEEEIEVGTETLDITVVGDNTTGIVKASYETGDEAYATMFSTPPTPALPASA